MTKLPKTWEVKTLGEVCEIFTGNSINQAEKEKNFTNINKKGLNYIATKDISFSNAICYENGVKIPQDKLEAFRIATADSTLLCIEGGSAGRKVAFLNQNVCFGNKLCCFKTKDYSTLNSKFVYFYLQSSIFIAYFYSNKSGLIGGITKANLKKIKIPLPPLDTQKQIVEILESKFAKIENATNALNLVKKDLVKLKASLLNSAFNGTLLHNNDLQALSHDDTASNLPRDWEVKTLGEICEINPKNKIDDNLEVSFIPMNLIQDKYQNKYSCEIKLWKNVKKGYTHLQNNCIAVAKITPCFENGKCVILRDLKNNYGAGTTELIVIKPNSEKVLLEFVFYYLNTSDFKENGVKNFKGTAGQLRISTDFVSNTKIPLPPLDTQKQIVEILESKFKGIEKLDYFVNDSLDKLSKLKASLLNKAFSGELVC